MKALVITKTGGPEALEIRDMPAPEIKPGQTAVRVSAGGLNFADLMTTQGGYPGMPAPPFIAGREFSGIEEQAKRRVMGYMQWGAFGEIAAANSNLLWPVPDHW
ncbi:MAG TPA: alcohol dehydrogenase catalytic domain-containing protein, partial [Candidatus Binatia bacterium]|nr:alcohol dehydrogenase catalytic domain-containing protein [Candidatus Binatia bacterium]